MQNRLQAIHQDGFTDDFQAYINQAHEGNRQDLRNQTLASNPGIEMTFYTLEALNLSKKVDVVEMYKEQHSKGTYNEYPYEVKMHRSAKIDKAIEEKQLGYHVITWYPYGINRKARIVLNLNGAIMAGGRYNSLSARIKGDTNEFNDCE